ncbi:uncharacterized protein LOC107010007 [Solanum pennellii]|uniref:Uncharacterized protein LOC107010007 n=1 Tax=Solanum pennellii TaxID=28526 RepID=A0ABM1V2M4_SOLPN|nr:uncharacterized protein LOC107010007 [Solanum pennellii]
MEKKFHGSSFRNSSPNNPKFIQIITSSDELCRLRIPVVFAERHCKNMLNPVFLEAPHGKAWEVEVENSQGQIWLAKGWNDFCAYYSISIRSLLVFTYNPRSHSVVAIYDQSKTEIEYPIDQEAESDEQEQDIPVLQANANVIEEEDNPINLLANANVNEEDIPVNLQANANVIEQAFQLTYSYFNILIPVGLHRIIDADAGIALRNRLVVPTGSHCFQAGAPRLVPRGPGDAAGL